MKNPRIGLVGDFDSQVKAHQGIGPSLALAGAAEGVACELVWIPTRTLEQGGLNSLRALDAVWCVPKTPYESTRGALRAIRFARENQVPFLGTCGGFQHALMEFAETVLEIPAQHQEMTPGAADPLIALMACSLVEQSGTIQFAQGSRLRTIYAADQAEEGYHCRFGLNPKHEARLHQAGFRITGRDDAGAARAMELDGHPFFIGTLFQPERFGLAGRAHPLIRAYVRAAAGAGDAEG